jgi:hypothetical protein
MVYCGALWCTVVYCGVLWCTVVYCGVLWCTVVYCELCVDYHSTHAFVRNKVVVKTAKSRHKVVSVGLPADDERALGQ